MNNTKTLTEPEAYACAERYCARAERCAAEVYALLSRHGVAAAVIDKIVNRLCAERFIDEERYAHAFIHDRIAYERWGRLKVRHALFAKHIDEAVVDRQLAEAIDEEEYRRRLATLLADRARALPRPLAEADRARLYRFAAQRGYESSLIAAALRALD